MLELELENIRAKAGALKAEISSLSLKREELSAACELIDQGVSKVEALISARLATAGEKVGGPKVSGEAGLVTEEGEEEVEEDDGAGNKKTVRKPKGKKS